MKAERFIRRYNHLNGKSVSKTTLAQFHNEIKKELDSKRIDSHSPLGIEVIAIEKKLSGLLGKMERGGFTVVGKVVVDKPINVFEYHRKRIAEQNRRMPKPIHDVLNGLENIQDDSHLDPSPHPGVGRMGGIGDTTYKVITDKILELIKADGLIWRKPWNQAMGGGPGALAHNHVTRHVYRGTNYYLNFLLLKEYSSPKFFTFKQVTALGGTVRKGEKAWPVVYFKWLYKNIATNKIVDEKEALNDRGGLKAGYDKVPALLYYNVFNYEQCDGLKIKITPVKEKTLKEKIESAEKILDEMPKRPKIKSGDAAWYRPSDDLVQLVPLDQFKVEQQYYSVAFHELIHSTARKNRVGRPLEGRFGSKAYAFEELIAELGASYLCGESGVLYHTLKNSAAYIQGWSKKLKEEMEADPKFFLRAAGQAQKASDFMLARGEFHDLKKSSPIVKESKMVAVEGVKAKKKKAPAKASDDWDKAIRERITEREKQDRDFERARQRPTLNGKGKKRLHHVPQVKRSAEKEYPSTPKNGREKSMNGIVTAEQISRLHFRKFDLTDKYLKDFHRLYSDTQVMIWGSPGSGKTVYVLQLAQYLADKLNLKVLFVAHEELHRSTFTEKIVEFGIGHKNLKFAKDFTESMVDAFDVVFFDSINSIRMSLDDYRQFVHRHPGKMYVLVVQSTKDGDFRGGKDWEHEVDVAGEVRNRKLILRKNRLDRDHYKKAEKLMTQDAIAEQTRRAEIKKAVKEGIAQPKPQEK